jgi:hypothetical protein
MLRRPIANRLFFSLGRDFFGDKVSYAHNSGPYEVL